MQSKHRKAADLSKSLRRDSEWCPTSNVSSDFFGVDWPLLPQSFQYYACALKITTPQKGSRWCSLTCALCVGKLTKVRGGDLGDGFGFGFVSSVLLNAALRETSNLKSKIKSETGAAGDVFDEAIIRKQFLEKKSENAYTNTCFLQGMLSNHWAYVFLHYYSRIHGHIKPILPWLCHHLTTPGQ